MEPCQVNPVRTRHVTDAVASAGLHDPDGRLVVLLKVEVDLAAQHLVPQLQSRKALRPDRQVGGNQFSFGRAVRNA